MLLLSLSLLIGCPKKPVEPAVSPASTNAVGGFDLFESLPVDPGVRHGTFDNGMQWFIENNTQPENRVVFRLTVDAGSALEDEDQQGLAHLLEHMAFNGTTAFPGNDLITYLESVGTKFGAHLNAHTSFEETVYKLTVPTDDPEILSKGFDVMKEWACCLTLDDEEIEKERGVVLEEWRRRLGAGQRQFEASAPMLYRGTPYAERLPIGTEESLKTFETAAVKRFYEDWYRPERMAIIVVGDVDLDATEAALRERFGSLPKSETLRERPEFRVDDDHETLVSRFEDPELTRSTLTLMARVDSPPDTLRGNYRKGLVESVAQSILNERLTELGQDVNAPYLRAAVGRRGVTVRDGADQLFVMPKEGRAVEAYEAALTELRRIQQHGVGESELDRAKKRTVRRYEQLLKEVETTKSVGHANEIVRHVLTQESMPGTRDEVAMAVAWVPAFTAAEVDAELKLFLASPAKLLKVEQPEKDGLVLPSEADLLAVDAAVAGSDLSPFEEKKSLASLVEDRPDPAAIETVHEQYVDKLGFTGWTLANGVDVWFKPTDFKEDSVIFTGRQEGGLSALDDDTWRRGSAAVPLVLFSGAGAHTMEDIGRFTAGKSFQVRPWISADNAGFTGSATRSDFDTALSMLFLQNEQPRFDPSKLELLKAQIRTPIENRHLNPRTPFTDAWSTLFIADDPRSVPPTLEMVDAIDLDAAQEVYSAALGDPSELEFVFVGNLPDDFEVAVRTWLGNLTPRADALGPADRGYRRKVGNHREVVRSGSDDKATYRTEFWSSVEDQTWAMRGQLSSTADILKVLLREKLREELGGIYTVSVSHRLVQKPVPQSRFRIEYTCDPSRVDELEAAMEAVIASVASGALEQSYVTSEIAKNAKGREERLRTNGFWRGGFDGALQRDEDPLDLLGYDARNASLTPDDVIAVVKSRLRDDQRGTVVLLPAE